MVEELSRALVIEGKNSTKKVPLMVNGKEAQVSVRSLTDLELADVIGIAKKNNWLEIFEAVSKKGKDKEGFDISVISSAIPLMIEICIRGTVLFEATKDPDKPKELNKEEKRSIFTDIGGFGSVSVGIEVLMMTLEPLEHLEGFIKPPKLNSSKS